MDNYLGQINLFPFQITPKGWMPCSGQILQITSNQALFALLGTQFGGNGQTTFALPNLNGAVAVGAGSGFAFGASGGEANHTLQVSEMPTHTHSLNADAATSGSSNGTTPGQGVVLGQSTGTSSGTPPTFSMNVYNATAPTNTMNGSAIGQTGGQPHSNMMPSLGLNFCIATVGIFPPRS